MRTPPHVMPALVTPFDEKGEIDPAGHRHNLTHLTESGIDGFVLGGSNGEGPYLEEGERARLIEVARETAPDAYLMMGVMSETVRGALRQLAECSAADSVLVLTPTTMARNRSPYVLNYFRHVVEASERPVFLYSVPSNTAYSMPVEMVAEIAQLPGVAGMKDSSGDVVRLQSIVGATPEDFLLYSGASAAVTAAIAVGCHGVISGSTNYAPRLVLDTVEAAMAGPAGARSLQQRLSHLSAGIDPHGVPGVKAAAQAAGLQPGVPRLPLEPAPADLADEVEAVLAG